jgi:ATP-dependent protease HslVU (ClpYQ) ATPase subunit
MRQGVKDVFCMCQKKLLKYLGKKVDSVLTYGNYSVKLVRRDKKNKTLKYKVENTKTDKKLKFVVYEVPNKYGIKDDEETDSIDDEYCNAVLTA